MILSFFFACTHTEKPDCENDYRYEKDGYALMRTYCTACHSSTQMQKLRYGAPAGVDLDTLHGIRQWSDRSDVRIWETRDMPPGGGMSDEERAILHEWLQCGVAGEEIPIPEVPILSYDSASHIVVATVHEYPDMENALILRREVDFGGSDLERVGLFSEELYYAEGEYAYLLGYIFYGKNQNIERQVRFEPALPIFRPYEEWSIDITMTIRDPQGTREESTHWVGSKRWSPPMDAQQLELSPLEIHLVSDKGEEWGWHLSSEVSISAQWVQFPNNFRWTALEDNIDIIANFPHEFPLRSGEMWIERVVEE